MNKELFNHLEETAKRLNNSLDKESQRYLDRCIRERRLDGTLEILKNFKYCLIFIFCFKVFIWTM